MTKEEPRRSHAPRPPGRLDLSKLNPDCLTDLVDDEWSVDFVHAVTAPKVDLWSLASGPTLMGRGEDGGIVALDIERIDQRREYAMTSEGVVMLGRRAPLPLSREGR